MTRCKCVVVFFKINLKDFTLFTNTFQFFDIFFANLIFKWSGPSLQFKYQMWPLCVTVSLAALLKMICTLECELLMHLGKRPADSIHHTAWNVWASQNAIEAVWDLKGTRTMRVFCMFGGGCWALLFRIWMMNVKIHYLDTEWYFKGQTVIIRILTTFHFPLKHTHCVIQNQLSPPMTRQLESIRDSIKVAKQG